MIGDTMIILICNEYRIFAKVSFLKENLAKSSILRSSWSNFV